MGIQNNPTNSIKETRHVIKFVFLVLLVIGLIVIFLTFVGFHNLQFLKNLFTKQQSTLPYIYTQPNLTPFPTKDPRYSKVYPTIHTASPSSVTPNPYLRVGFYPYDQDVPQTMLPQFLETVLQKNLLPSTITVKQHIISDGNTGTDYEFGANWKTNNNTLFIQGNFHYTQNTSAPSDVEVLIEPVSHNHISIPNPVDTSTSNRLSQQYLTINSNVSWNCRVYQQGISSCEKFFVLQDGKHGYGVSADDSNNLIFTFACFIPKDSTLYNQRTSCLLNATK